MPDFHETLATTDNSVSSKEELCLVLVHNLMQTTHALGSQLDTKLRGGKVTAASFNALLALKNSGSEGLKMGELGDRLVVSKSNITGLVDRMESRGWVQRYSCSDRRVISVHITPSGLSVLDDLLPAYQNATESLTSCLSDHEKKQLSTLLTILRRGLRQHHKGVKI